MNSEFTNGIEAYMLGRAEMAPALIEQVYERLVMAISEGSLAAGERLRQEELAQMLGVSRQPVSHALQLLKAQKLVQEAGRKGLAVAPIEPLRIRQLYQVRTALDGLAARLAAERVRDGAATAEQRHRAERALDAGLQLSRGTGSGRALAGLVRADVDFHRAIYELSGNPAIAETVAAQWPHVMRSMAAVLEDPGYRPRAWTEHAVILREVLAANPAGAERAARDHADGAGRETERRLLELGLAA